MFNFNPQPREVFKSNILDSVILKLDFPLQLRLKSGDPVEFQDKIKTKFPVYERIEPYQIQVKEGQRPEVLQSDMPIVHKFSTSDLSKSIELSANSFLFQVSGKVYRDFQVFSSEFFEFFKFLDDMYSIPQFNRIGLRKIDAHTLNEKWSKSCLEKFASFYNRVLVSTLSEPTLTAGIFESLHKVSGNLDEDRIFTIQYGLRTGMKNGGPVSMFLLDFDCYSVTTLTRDKFKDFLERTNSVLWDAFCWATTTELRRHLRDGIKIS